MEQTLKCSKCKSVKNKRVEEGQTSRQSVYIECIDCGHFELLTSLAEIPNNPYNYTFVNYLGDKTEF